MDGRWSLHSSKGFSQPLYCQERRKTVSKCLPGDIQDKTKQHNREQSCALLELFARAVTHLLWHLRKKDPEIHCHFKTSAFWLILTAIITDFKIKDTSYGQAARLHSVIVHKGCSRTDPRQEPSRREGRWPEKAFTTLYTIKHQKWHKLH